MDPAVPFMQHAAQVFVDANKGVVDLDYSPESIDRLEDWLARFASAALPPAVVHSNVAAAGAYLGEVLVRAGKASWTSHMGGLPGLQLHGEETVAFPIDKVAKRVTLGAEHDVRPFFAVAWNGPIRGPLPPGVSATVSAAPEWMRLRRER